MSDGFGENGAGLFAQSDPLGSSLKTSVGSCLCRLRAGLSVTWRERGTKSGLFYSEPTTSERRIDGIGSGLWATPAAMLPNDGEGLETFKARQAKLKAQHMNGNGCGTPLAIQEWPTPTETDSRRTLAPPDNKCWTRDRGAPKRLSDWAPLGGRPDLESLKQNGKPPVWSSPVTGDAKTVGYRRDRGTKGNERPALLAQARMDYPTPTANRRTGLQSHGVNVVSGSLNPAWVSQLMGFPDGWLDLPDEALSRLSGTRLSLMSQK